MPYRCVKTWLRRLGFAYPDAMAICRMDRVVVALAFLGKGGWKMTLYSDDPKASGIDARALLVSYRKVTSADDLALDLAPIGGAVAVFEPLPDPVEVIPD